MAITAEQVLTILNAGQPVDLHALELCVITRSTSLRFPLGEILVVDTKNQREPFGEGRKPAKWDVGAHYTTDWDAAHALSELVKREHEPGDYRWVSDRWELTQLTDDEWYTATLADLRRG